MYIPVFFRSYKNAPLANFVSLFSSFCYVMAFMLFVTGIKGEEFPFQEGIIATAVCVAIGLGAGRLAFKLAERKAIREKYSRIMGISRHLPQSRE